MQDGFYIFKINEITYKLTGVKDIFVTNLRVHIKAEYKGEVEHNNLDLYSSRARTAYSTTLASKFNVEAVRIEKDLNKILDYLEKENLKKLNPQKEEEKALTGEEIEMGMKFLKSKDLFKEIVKDMETLGYVGEDTNKLLVYLGGLSRLLPKPLSIFIQSAPSTGKSYLLETYMKMLPKEAVEWISSFSDQSFNYAEPKDFIDRIFIIGEALHNEVVEGHIRQMQSENKISRMVTIKDPKSGKMKSIIVKNTVRLVFMMTGTALPDKSGEYVTVYGFTCR